MGRWHTSLTTHLCSSSIACGLRPSPGVASSDRPEHPSGFLGSRLYRRKAGPGCPGIHLEVVKHREAKHSFVLLPPRWVVERSFAWAVRFRRRARDYERLAATLAGYHWL